MRTRTLVDGRTTSEARIYVVSHLRHLTTVGTGQASWWCVEHAARAGDLGVIYAKGKGLVLVFRIRRIQGERSTFCTMYGLATAEIDILAVRAEPLSIADMRTDGRLREMPALSRNFQRRSFRLDEPYLGLVLEEFELEPGSLVGEAAR